MRIQPMRYIFPRAKKQLKEQLKEQDVCIILKRRKSIYKISKKKNMVSVEPFRFLDFDPLKLMAGE